jgi:hypothetical protein
LGSTIFANIGWTRKTSADAVKVVAVNSHAVERAEECTPASCTAIELMITSLFYPALGGHVRVQIAVQRPLDSQRPDHELLEGTILLAREDLGEFSLEVRLGWPFVLGPFLPEQRECLADGTRSAAETRKPRAVRARRRAAGWSKGFEASVLAALRPRTTSHRGRQFSRQGHRRAVASALEPITERVTTVLPSAAESF